MNDSHPQPTLQHEIDTAYIAAISYALILTQEPESAAEIVDKAFQAASIHSAAAQQPFFVFQKLAESAADTVAKNGYNPSGASSRSGRPPKFGLVVAHRSSDPKESSDPYLLDDLIAPLQEALTQPDHEANAEKLQLLIRWLREFGTDSKLCGILGAWFQAAQPSDLDSRQQLQQMAIVIARPENFIDKLFQHYQAKWQEMQGEQEIDLFELLSLWPALLNIPPRAE